MNAVELRARLSVGARVVRLQRKLIARVREIEAAQSAIRRLREVLPIYSMCRKIRDDDGAYHQIEAYISQHVNVLFSHGFCPECGERAMRDIDDWTPPQA